MIGFSRFMLRCTVPQPGVDEAQGRRDYLAVGLPRALALLNSLLTIVDVSKCTLFLIPGGELDSTGFSEAKVACRG
jgi:hypothetical protein